MGTVCVLGSIEAIELACQADFDFVLVDWQHGSFNRDLMREAVRGINATSCHAMARPPSHDAYLIQWLLDMGYQSLLVPMVDTAEQARAIVEASYYPPTGRRSQASCRASVQFGPDYRQRINEHLILLAMIETVEAVENIDAISTTAGISGCFIGGTDLASAMGLAPGQPRSTEFEDAIDHVKRATIAAGKVPAIAANKSEEAVRRLDQGFKLVTLATDLRLLSNAFVHEREMAGRHAQSS